MFVRSSNGGSCEVSGQQQVQQLGGDDGPLPLCDPLLLSVGGASPNLNHHLPMASPELSIGNFPQLSTGSGAADEGGGVQQQQHDLLPLPGAPGDQFGGLTRDFSLSDFNFELHGGELPLLGAGTGDQLGPMSRNFSLSELAQMDA